MKLTLKFGLPFVEVVLIHKSKRVHLSNVLIDTGSASTIISADIAFDLDLTPEPFDKIRRIHGIGGVEFVYEKFIDGITLDAVVVSHPRVQVGTMDYGIEINAILGVDFLAASKVIIDMGKMTICSY